MLAPDLRECDHVSKGGDRYNKAARFMEGAHGYEGKGIRNGGWPPSFPAQTKVQTHIEFPPLSKQDLQ